MSSFSAKRQFDENLRLFGDATTQPEKFNLYAGLSNIADAIANMESRLDSIDKKLRKQNQS